METQNWPIRSKIVALVAVPILALSALWIFATTLTVGPASDLLAARTLFDEVGRPGEALVAELQRERRLSVLQLADPNATAALADQRIRTDRAIVEFRRRTSDSDVRDTTGELLDARIDQLLTAVDALQSGRLFVDRRSVDASGALGLYSGIIDAAFRTFSALSTLPDDTLDREARTLTELGRAREVLAQADALLAGVFNEGRFGPGEHAQFIQIVGTQRFLYATATAELPDADRVEYQQLTEGDSYVRLRRMEDELIGRGDGSTLPVRATQWQSSYDSVQRQLRDFELAGAEALAERSRPVAAGILLRLGLAGLLGFVAVLLSVVVALRIGRSLVRRLTGLRAAALTIADERLPDVVARLRKGEEVDVDTEAPPLDYGQDEIGQVGQAFNEVQRTAVASAIDEAALRRGLREVFLNIARRSQTLLHRQLALLDRMERRAAQPQELEDLFRLDHMATRMRRHAEDLVVLAGAAPGRGWRNPVSMVDVIRGAISEVEEYARVHLVSVSPAACAGRAVGDVIHLLAELIENATSFSPPHTRVQVTGQVVSNGYAIEIEDRGLGMTADAIEQANRRLVDPPDFDPSNSARLGLFVVALLGARHGVRVQLRTSPYGGVTAVALVPGDLVVPESTATALSGGQGEASGTVPAAQRGIGGRKAPLAIAGPDAPPATATPGPDAVGANGPGTVAPPSRSDRGGVIPDSDGPATDPGPGAGRGAGLGPRRQAGAALAALVAAAGQRESKSAPADPGESKSAPADPGESKSAPAGPGESKSAPAGMTPGSVQPAMDDDTVVLPAVQSGGPVRPDVAPIGPDGLPRRIRQTSLAPQLRNGPDASSDRSARPAADAAADAERGAALDEPRPRTPEQVRAVMAALQAGTARGRRDAETAAPADADTSGATSDAISRVADPGATHSEGDG
ncbi:nitrate- and nitrite sensing domain-containing protein [Plantactinospora sp. WMMB334]|uniref:sensor histidine kinase n=1 Tax=Plantactinospora sp. WMMB334 TaxID=3404119 RepID=UPI003B92EEBD